MTAPLRQVDWDDEGAADWPGDNALPAAVDPAVAALPGVNTPASDGRVGFRRLAELLADPELLRPPSVVIPRLAFAGRTTAIGSEPKAGKSTALSQAVAALAIGGSHLGEHVAAGMTIWLALDEHVGDLVRRLVGFGATDNVVIFDERPTNEELEETVLQLGAKLIVIDTLTEYAAGMLDGNSSTQWQPILAPLRNLCRRTNVACVLLDHTGKANPHSLLGSTQKAASVDQIITMTTDTTAPNVRHFRSRGRIRGDDFSTTWDGERSTLTTGELSIDARVLHTIVEFPGISRSKLRAQVKGRGVDIDAAVDDLVYRHLVDDVGGAGGHIYVPHRNNSPDRAGTGSGQGYTTTTSNRMGQARTGPGQPSDRVPDSPPLSRTLTGAAGDRVELGKMTDEEIERRAIQEEPL